MSRIKVVGKVVKKPSIVIGRGLGCKVRVRVLSGTDADFCDIVITRGSKPWRLTEGAKVCGIGILKGSTLWADWFREYRGEG